ncbi:nuclear transport factor 2 family protein [Planomonospora corallina]|uniref:Nuclear transport factor 2 family protein n=1 Tax=Planomonospora corallina TaxID=1806052 RepID=A0ABV8IH82_9ACTN
MTQDEARNGTFEPSTEDLASIDAWFAEYDALAARGAVEEIAGLAVFPLNLATDVPGGFGAVRQWDREEFVRAMTEVMGGGTAGMEMTSVRTPRFLTPNLVLVETEATVTVEGRAQSMRYADLLVRTADGWAFQTMVQGGWGHGWPPATRG